MALAAGLGLLGAPYASLAADDQATAPAYSEKARMGSVIATPTSHSATGNCSVNPATARVPRTPV